MAEGQNSSQSTQSTGANAGVFRDVNASASLGEFLNNFNASTSHAIGGTVSVGDRILGGGKNSSRQFGILQTIAVMAGLVIIFKLWQDGQGGK